MYDNVEVPIPATLNKTAEQTPGWAPKERGVNENSLKKIMPKYYGMVKCIDDNVGKILDCLREKGLIENTIVVFTADHGDLCGEQGRLNKGVPYEGSAKIPFILYYPAKVPAGTVVDEALASIDFLPTVLSLMEVQTAGKEQGRDASALLVGKKPADWHDVAFLRGTGAANWVCAVTDRYKLVYSPKDDPWLFDLEMDPHELTNRFGDAEYRPIVRQLTAELIEYCKTYEDANGKDRKVQSDMAAAEK
jgi:arylsulfatase A-like enzyme